jgi:hypothetical protein
VGGGHVDVKDGVKLDGANLNVANQSVLRSGF